jgi:capsular exopolysaccharide synthesis family protein
VAVQAPDTRASWAPVQAQGQDVAVEQYRKLAAALLQAQADRDVRVVLVTSAAAGEGKSLTAANLAVTLSRSYQRQTLVIDADLRTPSQHRIFRVRNTRGVSDWLRDRGDDTASTVQLLPRLTLLTAGGATSDPMAGLTSDRMARLIADAAASFDFVIVDAPSVNDVPDAHILAGLTDATVLVIRAGMTPHAAIDRAVAALGRERILGAVLNDADRLAAGRLAHGYAGR